MSTVKYRVFNKINKSETRTHVNYFTPRCCETFLKRHVLREFVDKGGKRYIIVTKWMLKKLREAQEQEKEVGNEGR